ncbi:MAG: pyruvate kinase [Candidatus Doudnabacteria bacterium]|nr:pyruvate kinase [Candidatus Doudnabacteria bacterium]
MSIKKTKIVCTLGPASQSVKIISEMVKAGMNVARLNFSHGDHENHALLIKNIRTVAKKLGKTITIVQDLHGPKIRVLEMKKPLEVKVGQSLVIGQDFSLDLDVMKSIRPKQRILIEDGLIELEVEKIVKGKIHCLVLSPGKIQSHKGVNLPRTKLKIPILTPKDIEDLKFGLKMDVDYVALSFVRSKKDVVNLKKLIKKYNPKNLAEPKIIAKIEKPEAVKNFDGILRESDAIMVARGDLGVEMPENQVPIIQKNIIQKCLKAAKSVIVATQMLDSMIRNPRPTRAEVSDVANAVIDQADCVMLSGESAFGKFPVRAVQEMARIIETTEKSNFLPPHKHLSDKITNKVEAMAEAVFDLSMHTDAKVIVGATESGFTARQIAHERPYNQHLVMLTPKTKTLRQMNLIWGVIGYPMPEVNTFEELMGEMLGMVKKLKLAKKGDKVVMVTGEPLGQKENLNLLEVKTV